MEDSRLDDYVYDEKQEGDWITQVVRQQLSGQRSNLANLSTRFVRPERDSRTLKDRPFYRRIRKEIEKAESRGYSVIDECYESITLQSISDDNNKFRIRFGDFPLGSPLVSEYGKDGMCSDEVVMVHWTPTVSLVAVLKNWRHVHTCPPPKISLITQATQ
jgi:hypothetical protein